MTTKSMPDLKRAQILYPDIDLSNIKLIGWGAGEMFKREYPNLDIELAYTICIHSENFGKTIHGLEVKPPEAILSEDPKKTLIIIFSAFWFDVLRQIGGLGKYRSIRATDGWGDLHDRSLELRKKPLNPRPSKSRTTAILMQGPLAPYTPMAIELTRHAAPDTPIIVSTWKTENPELLQQCKPLVDDIILAELPENSGPNGMNLFRQQKGVLSGLQELKKKGFEFALKTRTDTSLYGNLNTDILEKSIRPSHGLRYGLENKILFSGLESWRYIPFQLTDQYFFGLIDDLMRYWSFDENLNLYPASADDNLFAACLGTPESAICRNFISRNSPGIPVDDPSLLSLENFWHHLGREFDFFQENHIRFIKWKSISIMPPSKDNPQDKTTKSEAPAKIHNSLMDIISNDWMKSSPEEKTRLARRITESGFKIRDFTAYKNIPI